MISENIAARVCDRLVSRHATPYDVELIMKILEAVCDKAERINKLDGVFESVATAMAITRYQEAMKDPAVRAMDTVTSKFGADAVELINASGAADVVRDITSAEEQMTNDVLARVLARLDAI
jgi:hypothetical protein